MEASFIIGQVFCFSFICAAITATILIALNKWNLLELYQVHKPAKFPDPCLFCIGFWLCLLQAILMYYYFNSNIFYIAGAFAGASIARVIYNAGN